MQLVIQLIEVSQVQTAIQRPAPCAQAAGFPADYFGVAEESVQHLPHQDEGTEEQVGQTHQQDDSAELLCELQAVSAPLVLGVQVPLVLKQRARAPEQDELKVVLEALGEEHDIAQQGELQLHRQQGLVYHGHHVVFESQDAVINVQLCQLFLVDAHLLLSL